MTTHSTIEEFTVDDTWTTSDDVFEAVCEECRTPVRFETSYETSIGETFKADFPGS